MGVDIEERLVAVEYAIETIGRALKDLGRNVAPTLAEAAERFAEENVVSGADGDGVMRALAISNALSNLAEAIEGGVDHRPDRR
jgi:hypothetical protein